MNIDEFIKTLVPLDLILIQGISPYSDLVRNGSELLRGDGQFSHCGLVINKDICPEIKTELTDLLFLEVTVSTTSKVKNLETGCFSFGAQIRDLKAVLQELIETGCGVAVCHLKNNPYHINKEKTRMVLQEVYENYVENDKSIYDLNIFALLGTVFPSVRFLRDSVDRTMHFITKNHPWLFCSELVCIVYKELGLLEPHIDVQDYLPVDFADVGENEVSSILELPPVFLKRIHSPTKGGAVCYFICCCTSLFKYIGLC